MQNAGDEDAGSNQQTGRENDAPGTHVTIPVVCTR
jgi:hypothetical protein